jgi:hypothetical protein
MFSTAFSILLALSTVTLLIVVTKPKPIVVPRRVTTRIDPKSSRKQQ